MWLQIRMLRMMSGVLLKNRGCQELGTQIVSGSLMQVNQKQQMIIYDLQELNITGFIHDDYDACYDSI